MGVAFCGCGGAGWKRCSAAGFEGAVVSRCDGEVDGGTETDCVENLEGLVSSGTRCSVYVLGVGRHGVALMNGMLLERCRVKFAAGASTVSGCRLFSAAKMGCLMRT